jgi:hypothetical protein
MARLRSRSCIIDGEAVACDDNGVTSFNRVRYRRHDESIFLYAFDLIELICDDLRHDPLERRKATLEIILAKAGAGSTSTSTWSLGGRELAARKTFALAISSVPKSQIEPTPGPVGGEHGILALGSIEIVVSAFEPIIPAKEITRLWRVFLWREERRAPAIRWPGGPPVPVAATIATRVPPLLRK